MNPYKLYLVTDAQQSLPALCHVVKQAIAGGVTLVQVREKHDDVRIFIERAAAVKAVLNGSGVPLIINDRLDVALAVDADGVHLGQSDMPVALARQLLGNNKLIGLSVENEQQFKQAQQFPVDYLGLSAIFATPTKTNTIKYWGLDGLQWAMQRSCLPVVAIGGLNLSNIGAVVQTGVQGIALVSVISHSSDPRAAAAELCALIEQNRPTERV